METDDKIKIVDALVEIKLCLNKYCEMMGEYSYSEIDFNRLKSAFENIEIITKTLRKI